MFAMSKSSGCGVKKLVPHDVGVEGENVDVRYTMHFEGFDCNELC
jgi:hypothetical protein